MTLAHTDLCTAAQIIQKGRDRPSRPIGHLPESCRPKDVEDAIAIQGTLHQNLTEAGYGNLIGTKIGCTTQVMQEYLGVEHPCRGGIFDTTVRHINGIFEYDSFLHVGVECEIAAVLGSQINATEAPHSFEDVFAVGRSGLRRYRNRRRPVRRFRQSHP